MPKAWVTPSGILTPDNANAVYFFRIYRGSVKDCPDCLLMELPDQEERVAYFVERHSSCSLRRGDAQVLKSGPSKDRYSVMLELVDSGKRSLLKCANRKPEPKMVTRDFLVVVNGHAVATQFIDSDGVKIGLFLLFGEESIEEVADALRINRVPTAEL